MGDKGARSDSAGAAAAEALVADLAPLGPVSSRSMFGGHGIFSEGVMFGLVELAGRSFLKVDDGAAAPYDAAGADRHGRMPYREIPAAVRDDRERLVAWARIALEGAIAAKR